MFDNIVQYFVQKGYDHEDLTEMGLAKGAILVNQLILGNP
jgi:hypothetical protein